MKTLIFYSRCASVDSNSGRDFHAEVAEALRSAAEQGLAPDRSITIYDRGVHGTKCEDSLSTLLRMVETMQIDALVVSDLSRLSRDSLEVLAFINRLERGRTQVLELRSRDAEHPFGYLVGRDQNRMTQCRTLAGYVRSSARRQGTYSLDESAAALAKIVWGSQKN